ncbi:primase alpha helix C-terminal domain-containing protein [Streptococcus uberis]|uniref:primase alpha helix C-terminal domain-containing protein n=1 Tax=Streptococcus uberis TaxID=1349 RepID=UPI0019398CCA|nr:primase alpha helix C-terminal domain-containing protein [Streptococcus uberis]
MAIYESRGFGSLLYEYKGNLTPFEYIARFKPLKLSDGVSVDDFKKNHAPYCIAGKVKPDKNGILKRNNNSLIYRDLLFLDYDDITISPETFKDTVHSVLSDYSYILYPTIKHTPEKPRYRLVVKPESNLNESDYKATVTAIADKIGLTFDIASLTWSQLMGLPATRFDVELYDKVVHYGNDFPIIRVQTVETQDVRGNFKPPNGESSMTMKVINILLNGLGSEGGRNVTLTKFVGLLLNKWVNCDITTAYDLALIANEQTTNPLSIDELDKTFISVVKMETRKRGGNYR